MSRGGNPQVVPPPRQTAVDDWSLRRKAITAIFLPPLSLRHDPHHTPEHPRSLRTYHRGTAVIRLQFS